jgi:ArsR family transcriptional regulator
MHVIAIQPQTIFQALADQTRLRVMRLLIVTDERVCLCELVDSLLMSQYKLSRHVKALRQSGLLSATRDGRWIYHRLVKKPDHLLHLHQTIESLPDPESVFTEDLKRFEERLCLRQSGRCRVGIQHDALKSG